ncbi:hypothetical protein C4J83_0990 [Pseudomonas sp. LBUM920]|nr:hypothetical protein C4J83_0990 [Pseudomonas sp. LBUM920]
MSASQASQLPQKSKSTAVLAAELGQLVGAGLLAKAVGQSAHV